MTPARSRGKIRVVVDGSNIATEGRSEPSLAQLREAVDALVAEHPGAEVLVVVDASLEHKLSAGERTQLKELELSGDIVAPPAGSVGRGDAFILKIAERINAVVLSNDSFQEFQAEHRWLFDEGRLIGGKPVPKVGWIFTERLPVKATPRTVAAKKAAAPARPKTPASTPVKTAKATKAPRLAPEKPTATAKKSPRKKSSASTSTAPARAVKRDRVPVNAEDAFNKFVAAYKVRSHVDGTVVTFTSHGAVIKVVVDGVSIECYAPNSGLGTPPPARARDVLKRNEVRRFRLKSLDRERRIPELSLVQV